MTQCKAYLHECGHVQDAETASIELYGEPVADGMRVRDLDPDDTLSVTG